jgi:transcriptional regulator with XRE-family HTH domain
MFKVELVDCNHILGDNKLIMTKEAIPMNLGEKILHLRKLSGMSQEELASQITVSRQAISKWELGESVPDTDNVIQLCKLFNVSADYLLNDDVESDMDIPVVRENSDKLKRKYNLILLYIMMGLFLAFLGILALTTNARLTAIIGAVFVIGFGIGFLVIILLRKYKEKS